MEISVIMSIYNERIEWIKEAIDSILSQTFSDFEFIIVNDNPQRKLNKQILEEYSAKDSRIVVIENKENIGLTKSLNKALHIAKGKYIARMDADDISMPERFEKQIKYIKKNNLDLIGSAVININEKGDKMRQVNPMDKGVSSEKQIKYKTIAFHPTWLVNKNVYNVLKGYRAYPAAQDFDFLNRFIEKGFKINNMDEPLLYYRVNINSISNKDSLIQKKCYLHIIKESYKRERDNEDNYSEKEMLRYVQSSKTYKKIHSLSNHLFIKAMNYRKERNIIWPFFLFLSICISPIQIQYVLYFQKRKHRKR